MRACSSFAAVGSCSGDATGASRLADGWSAAGAELVGSTAGSSD